MNEQSFSAPNCPIPVLRFTELDSTSSYARRMAESGQLRGRAAVVVSERQSAGVGRFRRQWQSPEGGLWFTLAWPLPAGERGFRIVEGLGLRVGLACTKVLAAVLRGSKRPCEVRLKWPNDVMVNGRKLAGVLCELVDANEALGKTRFALVGVGVNANLSTALLPSDIRTRATGMLDHLGTPVDLDQLRQQMQEALMDMMIVEGLPSDILSEARGMLFGVGESATVSLPQGQKVQGVLLGIDHHGMAQLRTDDRVYTAPSGTVLMID